MNHMTETASVLNATLARQLATAGRKVTEWTAERDRLVREAVAAGGSYREVGVACGLSHTAVQYIVRGRAALRGTEEET